MELDSMQPLISRFTRLGGNRKFLVRSDGRLGTGPRSAQPKDVVAVLARGRVPFLLRPVAGKFLFTGECYVGDITKGGVLEGRRDVVLAELELSGMSW